MTASGTSPTKKKRRTKAEIQAIRDALYEVVAEESPATVRQAFYQLVSRGVIEKKESEYKTTVCRLLVEMRRSGDIPYDWIADNTRWMRKPRTYGSMADMLALTQQTYRRAIWNDQDAYVEIWLEKEALAGVLVDVTSEWDVPLMVTRGYPSVSYLHEAALTIQEQDKPTFLYYFGDHDPSGIDIDRFIEREIRSIADGVHLAFERVAVTPEQVVEMNLPTRPTKRNKNDHRAKKFEGNSVEVDAIKPSVLRDICRQCITRHIDDEAYQRTMAVEEHERASLTMIAEDWEAA